MTSVEDHVRAATRAQAAALREVRPLWLPPAASPGSGPASRARRALRWRSWMGPVTAAAAVLAVGVSLVLIRGIPNARVVPPSGSPAAPGVPPPYYVAIAGSQAGWYAYAPLSGAAPPANHLVVGATFTGRSLATVAPPRGAWFTGVTGAADDRTFVVDTRPTPSQSAGTQFVTAPRTWYLLRISPGAAPGYRLTRLPVPVTPRGTGVVGMALSPDGTKLALALQPGMLTSKPGREVLRIYSVVTGAVLRSWSVPANGIGGGEDLAGGDNHTILSWADGGRVLAFNYGWTTGPQAGPKGTPGRDKLLKEDRNYQQVRTLDLSRPGTDLLADSRVIWSTSAPVYSDAATSPLTCNTSLVITADGATVVCGAEGDLRNPGAMSGGECPPIPPWNVRGFLEYSATTRKLTRVIGRWQTSCLANGTRDVAVLWAGASGSPVLGYMLDRQPGAGTQQVSDIGVFTVSGYRPLPNLPSGATALTTAW